MSLANLRNSMEWALMVALVLGTGAIAQAKADADEPEGRIVKIGTDNNTSNTDPKRRPQSFDAPALGQGQSDAPRYWIGLVGGPVSPELRAHLDIPEDLGVIVRQIVSDGPAAKAGLKNFDILLRANDVDLHEMHDLVDLVRTAGEQQTQITLEVLRGNRRETVWITPAERPERITPPSGPAYGEEGGWGGEGPSMPNDVLRWFGDRFEGREGAPFAFRRFGPGAMVDGQAFAFSGIPNGVSVSIKKEGDQPAQITVKRGDESWEVIGDDPESLDQLPDDLRPFVEQMLGDTGQNQHSFTLPAMPNMPDMPRFHEHETRLQERLEAMEQHLRELEERLRGADAAAPVDAER